MDKFKLDVIKGNDDSQLNDSDYPMKNDFQGESSRKKLILANEIQNKKKRILYGVRTSTKIFDASQIQMRRSQTLMNTLDGDQQFKRNSCADKLIISEGSKWKATFDIIMLFMVGYSCFTTIYYVAFDPPANEPQQYIDLMVELLFVLDLILNFLQEYKDPETYESVRDLKKIAHKYGLKGSFAIDFLSIFPFTQIVGQDALLAKLFRLFRLPRLVRLIDIGRFNQLLKSFFENSSRDERIVAQYMLMYSYRILRLIIIAIIITYFIGCFWYMISNELNAEDEEETFVKTFGLNEASNKRKLIVSCYFALTTLSTVGYGDFYPVSNLERIIAILIMLCGVAFFSYIMGSFIEIISNYEKKMGVIDKGTDLHNWMTLLTRFTNNKPLPKSLMNQIESHFVYYWNNDRLSSLTQNDEYLKALPRSIKRQIMTSYLFEDIFSKFKRFFNTHENRETRFLYDIAFGFMPRRFMTTDEDRIIYDEEDEVPEMYFILDGAIDICYSLIANGITKRQYKRAKKLKSDCLICDHYVVNNQRAQYIYIAAKEVKAFALTKKFLLKEIFPKYPDIAIQIRGEAFLRYRRNLQQPINEHRKKEIEDLNRKSAYKNVKIEEKKQVHDINGNKKKENAELELNQYMKQKIDDIQKDIGVFTDSVSRFAQTCDSELTQLIESLDQGNFASNS